MTGQIERTTVTVEVPVPEDIYDRAERRARRGRAPVEEYLFDHVLLDVEFTTPGED